MVGHALGGDGEAVIVNEEVITEDLEVRSCMVVNLTVDGDEEDVIHFLV